MARPLFRRMGDLVDAMQVPYARASLTAVMACRIFPEFADHLFEPKFAGAAPDETQIGRFAHFSSFFFSL